MLPNLFARNPKAREVLSDKHVAIVGTGSIGSTIADMAARAGVGKITLVDPDTLSVENLGRHILTSRWIGKPKVTGMAAHISEVNHDCQVVSIAHKFDPDDFGEAKRVHAFGPDGCTSRYFLFGKPDLIVAATDSYQCSSRINAYALAVSVPVVFGGVWGPAKVAEILYSVPGKTACYECFASFRREEREIPRDPESYKDPNIDVTKVPGQEGLWCNVLMAASLQFQVVLGLFGLLDNIDFERTLWLMNISDFDSPLQPLAVTFGKVRRGCAVCDPSKLSELAGAMITPTRMAP